MANPVRTPRPGVAVTPPVTGVRAGDLDLQYRNVHGYRRAFRKAGHGPAILLIHGIGESSATWSPVLPLLARHYTVIAPDLLGHGGSDKPRADYSVAAYANGMRDLLSVLDIDRVTVIGHSLGGGVAMQFAYQFPERCDRLVLVGSAGVAKGVHPALRLAAAPGAEFVLPLLTSSPARQVVRTLTPLLRRTNLLGLGDDLDPGLSVYHGLGEPGATEAFLRTVRAAVDSHGQVITGLDRCYLAQGMPVLIIWGDKDQVVPVAQAPLMHAAMPGSRLEIFRGVGHFPYLTHTADFLHVVEDFITSTEPSAYDPKRWRTLLRTGRPTPAYHPQIDQNLQEATVSSGS